MKTLFMIIILPALVLFPSPLCPAQEKLNCDKLRESISLVEKAELRDVSPSAEEIYTRGKLKLYVQFSKCLQQDADAMSRMQRAAVGTDAEQDFARQRTALNDEKVRADAKIAILQAALGLAVTPAAPPVRDTPGDTPVDTSRTTTANTPNTATNTTAGTSDALTKSRTKNTGTDSSTSSSTSVAGAVSAVECDFGNKYTNAPLLLTDLVGKAATEIVVNNRSDDLAAALPQVMFYTIADAASPSSSKMLRGLNAYQYLSETARTDKQLGASPKSDGAVNAIEKPGFARLLGLAIEHGGINKANDGTNLTLSTSLYSLYTLSRTDTAETYASAGILNRVGVMASFAVDNKDNELENARRNNLTEWSAKVRLFGDRSTRSPKFQRFWNAQIRPLIRARLEVIAKFIDFSLNDPVLGELQSEVEDSIAARIEARLKDADYLAATTEGRTKIISDLILCNLKSNVYDPVKNGRFKLGDDVIKGIEFEYVPRLKSALDNLEAGRKLLEKKIEDLNKGPLGTFAYTNHRQPMASDYSETKFLFEQDKSFFRPLKLTGNFGLSFYHKPDRMMNQQKLRDISAALSFDGSTDSPFTEAENQSKITYSFVGRYERLFENRRMMNRKPDIATAQFLMEIPFIRGFSLPLSLTYANATEEERKKNVRFNFGLRLDTDKLFELLRAPSSSR